MALGARVGGGGGGMPNAPKWPHRAKQFCVPCTPGPAPNTHEKAVEERGAGNRHSLEEGGGGGGQGSFSQLGTAGGGGGGPTPPAPWTKFPSGPLADQQFSLAPSAPIFFFFFLFMALLVPLNTQHHREGRRDAGPPPFKEPHEGGIEGLGGGGGIVFVTRNS